MKVAELPAVKAAELTAQARSRFGAGDLPGAETLLRAALDLDPAFPAALNGLGEVDGLQGRWGDAALRLEATAEATGDASCLQAAAYYWFRVGEPRRGSAAYARALAGDPPASWVEAWLFWQKYDPSRRLEDLYRDTVAWARHRFPRPLPPEARWLRPDPGKRLHVGYVSGDFRTHAMARWIDPLLVGHDADQVRLTLFSNVREEDAETRRFRASGHGWVDLSTLTDRVAVQRVRDLDVDILVDLSGYTAGHRLGLFALRGAPVQLTMLGSPFTTGLPAMDYLRTDGITDPEGPTDLWYTEQLLRGFGERLAFRPPREDVPVSHQPCLRGRPFTFGCLSNPATVNADVMAVFARILRAVPGSRLRLLLGSPDDATGHRLRREALAAAGVDPERLDFFYQGSAADYHRQHQEIDLALGAFPVCGGTTVCETVWMGVPIICMELPDQARRPNRYVLGRMGLDHWIAEGAEAYVARAVEAAARPEVLAEERRTLRQRLLASSLCDEPARARDREALYRDLWLRWCRKAEGGP